MSEKNEELIVKNEELGGMRFRYRSEEEMKDSGVEWIGKIPRSWIVSRIKNFTKLKSVKGKANLELLSLYRDHGVVPKNSRDDNNNRPSEDLSNYKYVEKTNLVLNKMKVWQGSLAVSNYEGIVSPAYIICELDSNKVYPYYTHYLLRNQQYIPEYRRLSTGIRPDQWDISYENFANIIACVPKLDEQKNIVRFLNKKTTQFDSIISKKEALIERLEEAKKSLISEVVTGKVKVVKTDGGYELVERSMDEMKDSGVEWLGEIPLSFKTVRLGLISFVTKLAGFEYTNQMADALSDVGEVPIVRAGNIKMNRFINQEKEFIDIDTSKLLNRCALYRKCVLITFIGAGIGEVALFDKEQRHHLAPNVAKIEILGNNKLMVDEQYLIYYLMSSAGQEEVNKIKKASAQPSLSMETIRSMKIALPDIEEQYEINKYLSVLIEKIDQINAKTKDQIEKLKEAKQSLISEVVTGKIEILE